jgi:membrane-associated phospholipid phosphatase
VRLGYHTKDQVLVGAAVGAVIGFSWHALVSTVRLAEDHCSRLDTELTSW